MFALTCFFLARADALQKFSLGYCIVRLVVIGPYACSRADQLANDSFSNGPRRDLFREINYRFAKSCRALFQIVNAVLLRLTDNPFCILIPKQIIGANRLLSLRL